MKAQRYLGIAQLLLTAVATAAASDFITIGPRTAEWLVALLAAVQGARQTINGGAPDAHKV